MKFSILCIGSHGDVVPYVALGKKLKEEGHEVVIGAHAKAESLCHRHGLKFHPIGADLTETTSPEEARQLFEARGLKKIYSVFKLMLLFRRAVDIQIRDCQKAVVGAQALIYNPAAFAGPHLAERYQIPAFRMALQPELPTKEHPSFLIPMPKCLGRIGNWLGHRISELSMWLPIRGKINSWRKEALNLPPAPFLKDTTYTVHHLVAFSSKLISRPKDWDASIHMTGFCRLLEGDHWTPPRKLVEFLGGKEPVVYIGFGSINEAFSPESIKIIIDVLREKKIKAVIPRNLPGLNAIDLPWNVFPIDYAPHDWLFTKVSTVVHHGGVGTLSSGLHAGKPTWIIPCIVDQFFNGQKVHEWGLGPKPLPKTQLNRSDFEKGLTRLLQTPSYAEKAAQIKYSLEQENGVSNAYQQIIRSLKI